MYGDSPLSSPVSAQRRESIDLQHRQQRSSVTTIPSNASKRRPNSQSWRYHHERPRGDLRPSVMQPSVNSRPDSRTSMSGSHSRKLILRNRERRQEHDYHSADANGHEEFEIRADALVLRTGDTCQKRRMSTSQASSEETDQNHPVYHEYGNNSREIYTLSRAPRYDRGSESDSDSTASSQNQFSSQTYIPTPLFDRTDLNELRRQTKRRKGQDGRE